MCDERAVHRRVMCSGFTPAHVSGHRAGLNPPPCRCVLPESNCPRQRPLERLLRDGGELDASPKTDEPILAADVGNRICEPANVRDDWKRAVTHGAELRQSTRLEPRGNEYRVGAGLRQVRETLVVADRSSDPARMTFAGGGETLLELVVALPDQRELGPGSD